MKVKVFLNGAANTIWYLFQSIKQKSYDVIIYGGIDDVWINEKMSLLWLIINEIINTALLLCLSNLNSNIKESVCSNLSVYILQQ